MKPEEIKVHHWYLLKYEFADDEIADGRWGYWVDAIGEGVEHLTGILSVRYHAEYFLTNLDSPIPEYNNFHYYTTAIDKFATWVECDFTSEMVCAISFKPETHSLDFVRW